MNLSILRLRCSRGVGEPLLAAALSSGFRGLAGTIAAYPGRKTELERGNRSLRPQAEAVHGTRIYLLTG